MVTQPRDATNKAREAAKQARREAAAKSRQVQPRRVQKGQGAPPVEPLPPEELVQESVPQEAAGEYVSPSAPLEVSPPAPPQRKGSAKRRKKRRPS